MDNQKFFIIVVLVMVWGFVGYLVLNSGYSHNNGYNYSYSNGYNYNYPMNGANAVYTSMPVYNPNPVIRWNQN